MRSYPRNSPEAAARIVALAMLADGHVSRAELAALEGLPLPEHIGLPLPQFGAVVQTLCEDLLQSHGDWHSPCVDERTIDALLGDISEPALQQRVLLACAAVTQADAHLAEGEQLLLGRARRRWQNDDGLPKR